MEQLNRVKGYRVMAGLSQKELADNLGITREWYAKLENTSNFNKAQKLAITSILIHRGVIKEYNDIFLD